MMRKLILVILVCCATAVFADLRAEGDLYVKAANIFMEKSSAIASGPERNSLFQKARVLFERAIELYNLHLEKNPGDAGQLTPLITELNSRIFWCNKSTTAVYNKSATPSPEEAFKESGLSPSLIEETRGGESAVMLEDLLGEPEPLSPEEAKKLADKKKTADFLADIADLVSNRRTVEAKFLCKRAIRKPSMGIPRPLAEEILVELGYVEQFMGSVFAKSDKLVGTKVVNENLLNRQGAINGVITQVDGGMIHIDIDPEGMPHGTQLSIGVPLLSFSDMFLLRNTENRTKNIMTGIGSYFLLKGDTLRAKRVFVSLTDKKGDPEDMSPFISRANVVVELNRFRETEEQTANITGTLEKETEDLLEYYERMKADRGFKCVGRILDLSKGKIEYLLPVSKTVHEKTGMYLPEFAQALVYRCSACGGKKTVACPRCGGKGSYKVSMAKRRWCPQCKGEGTVPCPQCLAREKDKKIQGYIEKLREIFKRDEEYIADSQAESGKDGKTGSSEGKGKPDPGAILKEGAVTAGGFSFRIKDGTLTITGFVGNGMSSNVKNIAVNITLKGEDDKPVKTTSVLVEKVLKPGETEPVTLVVEKAPAYVSYSYSLAFEKAPAE